MQSFNRAVEEELRSTKGPALASFWVQQEPGGTKGPNLLNSHWDDVFVDRECHQEIGFFTLAETSIRFLDHV